MFCWWEEALAEDLGDVSSFWDMLHTDGNGSQEAHFGLTKDRGETVRLSPVMVIIVTQNSDAIFA